MKNKRLRISTNCAAEELDGELVILNILTGKYHKLNATGLFLYGKLKDSSRTIDELVSEAECKYTGNSLREDIISFSDKLIEKGVFVFEEDMNS